MIFRTKEDVEILNKTIDKCSSDVIMMSPEGERFVLNSDNHPDASILMGSEGELYEFFTCRSDDPIFIKMFYEHPDMLCKRCG